MTTRNWSGELYSSQSAPKKKRTKLSEYTQEYNQLLKMMLELIKIAIYSSSNSIPFLNLSDIHSSINSIILCSTLIHWNTIQYFEYAPYNYNHDHNCIQRLCQHFLKTSSPCLPIYIRTKQKVLLLSVAS